MRRYAAWALVAFVSVSLYALTSGATIYLIDPLFTDVLQAGGESLSSLQLGGGAVPADATAGLLSELRNLNLRKILEAGYQSLKRHLGIDQSTVIYFVPLLIVATFWLRSLADFLSGYSFQYIGVGVTTRIRNDIFRRIMRQSTAFHSRHPTGELASRVIGDVGMLQVAVSTRVLDLFQQSATLVVLGVLLLSTNFELAVMSLIVVPIVIFPIVRFGIDMRRTSRSSQERMADLSQLLVEAARGHRVVRAFGMEEFESRRFEEATRRHMRVRLRAEVLANISGPVVSMIAVVGVAAFIMYAGHAIRSGELTGVQVVQFLVNLALLYDPVRRLNKVHLMVQEAAAAVHRVIDLLAIPLDVEERPGAIALTEFNSRLAFEDVSFSYGDEPVLRDIDLEIRRGEVVALVGPSGAGKTTLANLMLRFADPASGRLTIDGHDLRDLTLKSLSSLMSVVTQETVLFDDTIRNNIAYGRSDLPLDAVRAAARAAYADDFILRAAAGYETRLGEGGLQLSGGERQRIAIARALLSDTPILVLDEATSQLDSESEALVRKALQNLMRDRTTLVIAHRFSTVMSADRIVVIDSGRIVDQGSHHELLHRDGVYRRLYDLQAIT